MKQLQALIAPLGNRLKLLAATCRILGTSQRGGVVVCQTSLLHGETRDGNTLVQQAGFRSRPIDGAAAVVVFPGGDRGTGLVLGVHDGARTTELEPGEAELYAPGGAAVRVGIDGVSVEGDLAGDGDIADWRGSLELVRELFDSHVHTSPAGPTGPPTVPMRGAPGEGGGGESLVQFVEVGSGPPPPSSERVRGSRYLDVATGAVFELEDADWSSVGTLQGPQGSLWITGAGEPPAPSGREGDVYLDTLTGDVYTRDMHGWTFAASLLGPPGPAGTTDHGAQTGLEDDDHPQYHTDERALEWLESRDADDLPEGSTHLFLTPDERSKLVGGEGSGLDADTVRGLPPAAFALAVHGHSGGDINGGVLDGGTP